MQSTIQELRLQFYAQTDIEIKDKRSSSSKDVKSCVSIWQKYAIWLEIFQAEKLNSQFLKENQFLRDKIYQVLDILETTISERI